MADFHMPDSWYNPPTPAELAEYRGTNCLGQYPATRFDDAYTCLELTTCYLCEGPLCVEHDDYIEDCGDGPVHEACHKKGCSSSVCAADARDDALLHQQEVEDGR